MKNTHHLFSCMLAHFSSPRWCFHAQQANRQRFMCCQTSLFIHSAPKRKFGARKSVKNILTALHFWQGRKSGAPKVPIWSTQISKKTLAASALFAKVQLQISLRPLTASALFAKVQLQISLRPLTASHVFKKCQFGASKVSIRWAQISKKSLTASALFEKVQLQISSRTLTASRFLSGTFIYVGTCNNEPIVYVYFSEFKLSTLISYLKKFWFACKSSLSFLKL